MGMEGMARKVDKEIRQESLYSLSETEFFARHDYRVDYVGNPTANEIAEAMLTMPSKEEFFRANGLGNDRPTVALLPGSRLGEIRNNLPLMAEAASRFPNVQAIVAGAPTVDRSFYESVVPGMKIIYDAAYPLLAHSQAALVTSGTATLETAAIRTPQVWYATGKRLKTIAYKLFEHILKVEIRVVAKPYRRQVVPELLLHLCNPRQHQPPTSRRLASTTARNDALCSMGWQQDRRQRLGS